MSCMAGMRRGGAALPFKTRADAPAQARYTKICTHLTSVSTAGFHGTVRALVKRDPFVVRLGVREVFRLGTGPFFCLRVNRPYICSDAHRGVQRAWDDLLIALHFANDLAVHVPRDPVLGPFERVHTELRRGVVFQVMHLLVARRGVGVRVLPSAEMVGLH